MLKFEPTVEKFLSILKAWNGAIPTFQLDYEKKRIYLLNAPSGLIKKLHEERGCCPLVDGKLIVEFFAD